MNRILVPGPQYCSRKHASQSTSTEHSACTNNFYLFSDLKACCRQQPMCKPSTDCSLSKTQHMCIKLPYIEWNEQSCNVHTCPLLPFLYDKLNNTFVKGRNYMVQKQYSQVPTWVTFDMNSLSSKGQRQVNKIHVG